MEKNKRVFCSLFFFGGTGNISFSVGGTTYTIVPSGGIVFSGSADLLKKKVISPIDGIVFSGTGNQIQRKVISVTGQLIFSGTGNMTSNTSPPATGNPGERLKVGTGV